MLPAVVGPCRLRIPRFFYNSTTGQCEEFIYGGCLGNQNNFLLRETCELVCRPTSSTSEFYYEFIL